MKRAQLMPPHAALIQIFAMPFCNLKSARNFVRHRTLVFLAVYFTEQCSNFLRFPALMALLHTQSALPNSSVPDVSPQITDEGRSIIWHGTKPCSDNDENVTSLHPQKFDAVLDRTFRRAYRESKVMFVMLLEETCK